MSSKLATGLKTGLKGEFAPINLGSPYRQPQRPEVGKMGAPKRGSPAAGRNAAAHLGRTAEKKAGGLTPPEPLGQPIRRFLGGPLHHGHDGKTTQSQASCEGKSLEPDFRTECNGPIGGVKLDRFTSS
jgi:hypothetical protein